MERYQTVDKFFAEQKKIQVMDRAFAAQADMKALSTVLIRSSISYHVIIFLIILHFKENIQLLYFNLSFSSCLLFLWFQIFQPSINRKTELV